MEVSGIAQTKEKRHKKKGRSTQELIGVKSFTKYGLETQKGELLSYLVGPTNISVLSRVNIEIKIRHLMMVLSGIPDIEIACTDSCECFDDNKSYLQERMDEEQNPKVRRMKKADIKRFLAIYFGASMNGDQMPDVDGEQFYEVEDDEEEN